MPTGEAPPRSGGPPGGGVGCGQGPTRPHRGRQEEQMAGSSFGARSSLEVGERAFEVFRLDALQDGFDVARLPYSIKILLENVLRHEDGVNVRADDVEALARWDATATPTREIAFAPARILMQDFTG